MQDRIAAAVEREAQAALLLVGTIVEAAPSKKGVRTGATILIRDAAFKTVPAGVYRVACKGARAFDVTVIEGSDTADVTRTA